MSNGSSFRQVQGTSNADIFNLRLLARSKTEAREFEIIGIGITDVERYEWPLNGGDRADFLGLEIPNLKAGTRRMLEWCSHFQLQETKVPWREGGPHSTVDSFLASCPGAPGLILSVPPKIRCCWDLHWQRIVLRVKSIIVKPTHLALVSGKLVIQKVPIQCAVT